MFVRFGLALMVSLSFLGSGCSGASSPHPSAPPSTASSQPRPTSADCDRCGWFTSAGPAASAVEGATCARPIRVSSPDPNTPVDTFGATDPCAPSCCAR